MKFHDYYVLLSYPDYDKPNNFLILDADGEEVYASKGNTSAVFPNEQGDWSKRKFYLLHDVFKCYFILFESII